MSWVDYPITITAADIEQHDPCESGLAAFREHYPDGVTVRDAAHQSALLAGPLGMQESWAVDAGLLPPIRIAGGHRSTLTGGLRSTLTGGLRSTLTGGDDSTLTGGYGSTLTGGLRSTLTGGDGSTLTGGHRSTLTGGYGSTLTGGDDSTLTGGDDSTLTWRYWDGSRYRLHTVYTGEDGIEAGVAYVGRFAGGKLTIDRGLA